jgi:hypothetical protein
MAKRLNGVMAQSDQWHDDPMARSLNATDTALRSLDCGEMNAGWTDAIAALIYEYAERIDRGDLEGLARLFANATFRTEGGGVYQGAAAVLEVLQRLVILYDGVPRTKHVTTNLTIECDAAAGTATARSYFTVLQATPALPLQAIIAGRYHDRFVRRDNAWQFAERLIHIDLLGDVRHHLRVDLSGR